MLTLLLIVLAVAGLLVVMRREAGATPALALLGVLGLVGLVLGASVIGTLLLIAAAAVAIAGLPALRSKWLTPRIFATFKKVAPKVSDTERAASPGMASSSLANLNGSRYLAIKTTA